MKEFQCTVLMEPVGKARARTIVRDGKSRTYTPKPTVEAEMRIRMAVSKTRIFYPAGTPLEMELVFVFKRPKSVKRVYHTTKPDATNACKLVEDALESFLYPNDSQIVKLDVTKCYAGEGDLPRIYIRVRELEG